MDLLLDLKVEEVALSVRSRQVSATEVTRAYLTRMERVQLTCNAVVQSLTDKALEEADTLDRRLTRGEECGPLVGVPFSVKDSIAIGGEPCTAGIAERALGGVEAGDATLVRRLRNAGAIPIARTNLPELLFSFETDNLSFGRTNNPYDLSRSCGGSSGGEAALLAACGSAFGLGSDAFGSVRLPAAFCGIAGIKPTSGRLPRTGHVPPAGSWVGRLWQIGPMARWCDDLLFLMPWLFGPDGFDVACPPVPLDQVADRQELRIGFFTHNGFTPVRPDIAAAIEECAQACVEFGWQVESCEPPGLNQAYELELSLVGADGCDAIDEYLAAIGRGTKQHPYLRNFLDRLRPFRCSAGKLAQRWAQWDDYREHMLRFFAQYDAVLSPVYTQTALPHGGSQTDTSFEGFSYTMAWNVAGYPASTVRCAQDENGLPINVQVIGKPWQDMTTLRVAKRLEERFGGWEKPPLP